MPQRRKYNISDIYLINKYQYKISKRPSFVLFCIRWIPSADMHRVFVVLYQYMDAISKPIACVRGFIRLVAQK